MTNAVFVCVIISVLCGCIVLVSHYYNMLNDHLYVQEELISRNESSFIYSINDVAMPYNQVEPIDVFGDGIYSSAEKKQWGFYDILICKTGFKNDTISKVALVGQKSNNKDNLALYVTDYDKPLKLSGKTKIFGKTRVPQGRTEQAYLNGKKGNTVLLKGQQAKSSNILPKIDKTIDISIFGQPISLKNAGNKNPIIVNPFDKETKVIDITNIKELRDITCKGNIVFISKGALKIANSAKLNDVIVYAPKVEIQSGFTGNLQIIAKEKVIVDEHVSLLYPSSIYVKNDTDSISVSIKGNSTIAGGIVVDGETHTGSLKRFLTINEKATVIGNIYCYGKTQLNGEVIGSVYTDKFFLRTKSSSYENVVLNGIINKDALHKNFVELPLFKNNFNEKSYAVIKEF